jgi:P27 family predicted phage terminase small subunit
MPSPRPLPTHLKLVRGTLRKSRINTKEPRPPQGLPRIPTHLGGHARAAWLTYAPLLAGMGVLTKADAMALEALCVTYGEWRRHDAVLAREGETYSSPVLDKRGDPVLDDGVPVPGIIRARPEVSLRADADRRLRAWLIEFGLSPSARSKVHAEPPTRRQPGQELLDQ